MFLDASDDILLPGENKAGEEKAPLAELTEFTDQMMILNEALQPHTDASPVTESAD